MLIELKRLLDVLESKIDNSVQNRIIECHKRALNWEETDRLPLSVTYPYPAGFEFQPFPHREIFLNPEKMLFNELVHAFDSSIYLHELVKDDLPYTVRANFGTVLIASLLGGKVEQRDDSPPWVIHFEDEDSFLSIFDRKDNLNLDGFAGQVKNVYQIYNDVLSEYPNLKKCVNLVLPDLQGPIDTLELLKGSDIYMDFLINPDLVSSGLDLVANVQIDYAKSLLPYVSDNYPGYSFQHSVLVKGNILIRNDSSIMISSDMYKSQVAEYDDRVLNAMGGGGVHSCGKIDFSVPEMLSLSGIKSFDFGQSYLNDIEKVYPIAKERKIPFLRLRPSKELLLSDELKVKYPTGVSLVYDADSFEQACYISKEYSKKYGSNF